MAKGQRAEEADLCFFFQLQKAQLQKSKLYSTSHSMPTTQLRNNVNIKHLYSETETTARLIGGLLRYLQNSNLKGAKYK